MRSSDSVSLSRPKTPTANDLAGLAQLHRGVRKHLYYINGAETLWYLKTKPSGATRIERQTTTLVLAAMHRLSELCRYRPLEMDAHLSGKRNWLISEFIQMSALQYLDEISSEITRHQFLAPNVRPA